MATMTFKGTKSLKYIKNDHGINQFLSEMFTTDEDGIEHPELIKIFCNNGRVVAKVSDDNDGVFDGRFVECSDCEQVSFILDENSDVWDNCQSCGAEFEN